MKGMGSESQNQSIPATNINEPGHEIEGSTSVIRHPILQIQILKGLFTFTVYLQSQYIFECLPGTDVTHTK